MSPAGNLGSPTVIVTEMDMGLQVDDQRARTTIVIVAWNGKADLMNCVDSLRLVTYSPFDVVIVDNGSDENLEDVTSRWEGLMDESKRMEKCDHESSDSRTSICIDRHDIDTQVTKERVEETRRAARDRQLLALIRSDRNLGFSGGNNLGLQFAQKYLKPNYIFLLNSDTIVKSDTIDHLVEFMDNNPDVAICSPIQFQYPDTSRILCAGLDFDFSSGCRLNAEGMNELMNPIPVEVTYVSGATLFVRTATLEKLGPLDDAMFFGAEDLDLCLRTWISGQRVMLVPASVVYHKHHVSISRGAPEWLTYYGIRSLIRCIIKNLELRNAAIAGILLLLRQTISSIVDVFLRRNFRMAVDRWRAIVWNVQMIRETLELRRAIQENRKVRDGRFLHLEDWKQMVPESNV